MALVKTPIINDQLDKMNHILGSMVRQKMNDATEVDIEEIAKIVRRGLASEVYDIGDQIIVPWKDTSNVEYSIPFDIVHFGNVTLEDGEVVPGMYLQSHYAVPAVQFDANEAFYYCDTELAAGTYYLTFGVTLGDKGIVVKDNSIQFTLTKNVPAGGQLVFPEAFVDKTSINDFTVKSYESASSLTPLETVTCSLGASGTSLGTFITSLKYAETGLNELYRACYGYNRWNHSGLRQYLNSKADSTKWWAAKNPYDRAPNELSSKNGFMSGFGDDFLSVLKPVKVTTALNTTTDSQIGTTEDTFDTFFLPSKRNLNLIEELSGVEGEIWDYWYRATKGVKPVNYQNGAAPITYALESHSSAQTVRLRSARRGDSCYVWLVVSSGSVSYDYARTAYRFAPACVIC